MDEIDKIKTEKIKSQFIREKESRDKLLQDIAIRRKIEYLKEKKIDNELLNNAKKIWQKEINEKYMQKKMANEEMNKTMKEIELKKIKLKDLMQKQKEEEITILKEKQKTEERQDKERQKIFDKINYNMNKFIIRNAEEIVAKNKQEQQKEEEKIQFYIEEKRKAMEEKEMREKMRKKKEKLELKKFLDMQVEEKQKEKIFLKELEHEQARIWNVDIQKYNEDEKIIDNKIKKMNRRNFEYILKQMKENSTKKLIKHNTDMTNDEYDMNKELLNKEDILKGLIFQANKRRNTFIKKKWDKWIDFINNEREKKHKGKALLQIRADKDNKLSKLRNAFTIWKYNTKMDNIKNKYKNISSIYAEL